MMDLGKLKETIAALIFSISLIVAVTNSYRDIKDLIISNKTRLDKLERKMDD